MARYLTDPKTSVTVPLCAEIHWDTQNVKVLTKLYKLYYTLQQWLDILLTQKLQSQSHSVLRSTGSLLKGITLCISI